ncbi:hypothetical protein HKCCE4037_10065 [Rhodobacterales bacterium HKCCE4037]|nr:hypothetical protein [Rhodobacterales bacterium HKCCE4037]
MSVDRAAWGWCPSVLRPMPLDDGLMVRIRVPGGALTAVQAEGLAGLAERFGAGFIELTNRANLQLRGLSEAEHGALVPELEALGLAAIDRTPSGRVNITQSPFRDAEAAGVAVSLAEALAEVGYKALPQKFGFVVDMGAERVLADVPGDIRIEGAEGGVIVRASGAETGVVTDDPVGTALALARWFRDSGLIGADGRGRMAEHVDSVPDEWCGGVRPNAARQVRTEGPEWLRAEGDRLAPDTLRAGLVSGVAELRVTPFRALYLPEVASAGVADNKAGMTSGGLSGNAV